MVYTKVHILKFRPIIDAASTWVFEQYLSKIFQPLTGYVYNMRDSSDVVNRIKNIPPNFSDLFFFVFIKNFELQKISYDVII